MGIAEFALILLILKKKWCSLSNTVLHAPPLPPDNIFKINIIETTFRHIFDNVVVVSISTGQ